MVDVGRRKFMSGAGMAAAGVAVTSVVTSPEAKAAPAAARVNYPANRLAGLHLASGPVLLRSRARCL